MQMTPDEFRRQARAFADLIADYWETVQDRPVTPDGAPGDVIAQLPAAPPDAPETPGGRPGREGGEGEWDLIRRDLHELILPNLTHWQHPGFFGYFPCNASFPAILAEFVSAGLNVNGMLWASGPAITELEIVMMDWMAIALGLPDRFRFRPHGARPGSDGAAALGPGGGVIQGTASEATLTALVAARLRAIQRHGPSARGKTCLYTSTQAHSSVVKSAVVAGLADDPEDRRLVRLIGTTNDLAMDPTLLARAMDEDARAGLIPAFVCATLGTTSSLAFDPVPQIAELCDRHGAWLHVDAAHAGTACVCPEFRWMLAGTERADSLCMNPHKRLLVNFDCDLFYVADWKQLAGSLSITPEYLRNAGSDSGAIDYRDWHVPLGRRFRALKLWFVLRRIGLEALREHVRLGVSLAGELEGLVGANGDFEVVAPRRLDLVCVAPVRRPGESLEEVNERARRVHHEVNRARRVYLSHTILPLTAGSRYVLRVAIGGSLTRREHVALCWEEIQRASRDLGHAKEGSPECR